MKNSFESPSLNNNEQKETITIKDSRTFKEAIDSEELLAANEWLNLKRAIHDEWRSNQDMLIEDENSENILDLEDEIHERIRVIDHRENELSKKYREKKMWPEAKKIISDSINTNNFQPRKNRLEEQSGLSYDNIPEPEGF